MKINIPTKLFHHMSGVKSVLYLARDFLPAVRWSQMRDSCNFEFSLSPALIAYVPFIDGNLHHKKTRARLKFSCKRVRLSGCGCNRPAHSITKANFGHGKQWWQAAGRDGFFPRLRAFPVLISALTATSLQYF